MAIDSSALNDQRLVKALDELTQDFSKEDVEMLKEIMAQNTGSEIELLVSLMNYTYQAKPVPVREFVEDQHYLGLKGQVYPVLLDDLEQMFSGDYDEAVFAGAIGFGKCLSGDTLICTEDGYKRLQDICKNGSEKVATVDSKGNSFFSDAVAIKKSTQKCLKLTFKNGLSLECSEDHPILTDTGWKKAIEVSDTDFVASSIKYPTIEKEFNEELVIFLAYMVADGNTALCKGSCPVRFTKGNSHILEEFKRVAYAVGADSVNTIVDKESYKTLSVTGIMELIKGHGLFGKKSIQKKIPDYIWESGPDALKLFLNRLYTCDGSIYQKKPYRIEYSLGSEQLANDTLLALRYLGIYGYKFYNPKKCKGKTFDAWSVIISNSRSIKKFIDTVGQLYMKPWTVELPKYNSNNDITPVNYDRMKELRKLVGGIDKKTWNTIRIPSTNHYVGRVYAEKILALYKDQLPDQWLLWLNPDICWEKLSSKESIGIKELYDIDVPETRNYIANGLVVHNSTVAEISMARMVYEVSCFKNPQKALGLMDGSVIAFINVSINKDSAKKIVFQGIKSKMENSPYFREQFPIVNSKAEELRLANNVWIFPVASGEQGILGYNVLGGVMDEVNFLDYIENSARATDGGIYDQAESLRTQLIRRMKSRYMRRGKLPGILLQVSSAAYPDDYTERRIEEAQENPKIFWRRYSQWDTPPADKYCGQTFQLSLGDLTTRPQILTCEEELADSKEKGLEIIDVPIEYKFDFEKDIDSSIRDLAGRPTLSIHPFILYREKVSEAMERGPKELGLEHPFGKEVTTLQDGAALNPDKLLIPRYKKLYENADEANKDYYKKLYNNLKQKPRYIHIDLAKTSMAGFSMGHVHEYVEVTKRNEEGEEYIQKMPVIVIELMLRIVAPQHGEIQVAHVRSLVHELRSYGYRLNKVSLDQFQCLAEDTMIATDKGTIPLHEVEVGNTVESRIGPRKVKNKWFFGKRPTLIIETKDGDRLEGTEDHKIECRSHLAYSKGNPYPVWEWKKMKEIEINDIVRMPVKPVEVDAAPYKLSTTSKTDHTWREFEGKHSTIHEWEYPEEMTEELSEWLGIVWGDGHINQDGIYVTVSEQEKTDAQNVFYNLFKVTPSYKEKYQDAPYGELKLHARWLVLWMKENGMEKPYIPECILRSGKSIKSAFLKGLFAADGSIDKNDGKVSLSTKHKKLAEQVKLMLLVDFGLQSNIAIVKRGHEGDYVKTGEHYILQLRGSRRTYYETIGFSYQSKMERLKKFIGIKGRSLTAKVKNITQGYTNVYDLEVEEDPSYIANGFYSHNSLDTQQQLIQKGIDAGELSVDRKPDAYNAYKDALYEDRILMYWYEPAYWETIRLEKNEKTGKIDHPANKSGSKDVSDAIAGVCHHCVEFGPHAPSLPPRFGNLEGGRRGNPNIYTKERNPIVSTHRKNNLINDTLADPYGEDGEDFSWLLK